MDLGAFEDERRRLLAIANRIVGAADADDVLQEAQLRFVATEGVDDPPAWLTTVVTRLCLDALRKRRTRDVAEAAGDLNASLVDPEVDLELAERIGDAMEVVLDSLVPAERAAFVLHDVFGYRFEEVAAVLGRSVVAVRQLASRARRKVQGAPEPAADRAARQEHTTVVRAFLEAARGGDLTVLLTLLAPDAVMRADQVGQQLGTTAIYDGAPAVAERMNGAKGAAPVMIDGELAAAWIVAHEVKVAFVFHVEHGLVREIELIADPEVLATMEVERARR